MCHAAFCVRCPATVAACTAPVITCRDGILGICGRRVTTAPPPKDRDFAPQVRHGMQHTNKQTNIQNKNKRTKTQSYKHTHKQTNKQTHNQTIKQTNKQTISTVHPTTATLALQMPRRLPDMPSHLDRYNWTLARPPNLHRSGSVATVGRQPQPKGTAVLHRLWRSRNAART